MGWDGIWDGILYGMDMLVLGREQRVTRVDSLHERIRSRDGRCRYRKSERERVHMCMRVVGWGWGWGWDGDGMGWDMGWDGIWDGMG